MAELSRALAERYTVGREIACGGMSTVYFARDERHHRDVAIKVMHSELTHGAGVQRFLREIAIASMRLSYRCSGEGGCGTNGERAAR